MAEIKILSDRIIIDGHEPTTEQCETATMLANALAESKDFRKVQYKAGYAEFEKVGKAEELKFAPTVSLLKVNWDSNITKVVYRNSSGGETTFTNGELKEMTDFIQGHDYTFEVTLNSGYVLDTVTLGSSNPDFGVLKSQTDASFVITAGLDGINHAVTLTSKKSVTKKSVDLTTLPNYESLPAGTYALGVKAKAAGYTDSDLSSTASFTKLAAPVATAADTTVSWEAVTSAESYDVYVDGELYENTTGGG